MRLCHLPAWSWWSDPFVLCAEGVNPLVVLDRGDGKGKK